MTTPHPRTAWVLTDGKAGDVVQCLGICDAIGIAAEERIVRPFLPWTWLMPWGPVPPADRSDRAGSPIAPPFPDIVVASGRRAVPYIRQLHKLGAPSPFTVFLKDPRCGSNIADFIWVPQHDRLRDANVMATLTSPHQLTAKKLKAAQSTSPPFISERKKPLVAVLIGGDSPHFRFTFDDVKKLSAGLSDLAQSGAGLIGTLSRRSMTGSTGLADAMRRVFQSNDGWLWDGTGDNPYTAILAHADATVVTADSVNMIGEAVSTGLPVFIFQPSPRGTRVNHRIHSFLRGLDDYGAIRPFTGHLETYAYEPLNATPEIARAILERYAEARPAG